MPQPFPLTYLGEQPVQIGLLVRHYPWYQDLVIDQLTESFAQSAGWVADYQYRANLGDFAGRRISLAEVTQLV